MMCAKDFVKGISVGIGVGVAMGMLFSPKKHSGERNGAAGKALRAISDIKEEVSEALGM